MTDVCDRWTSTNCQLHCGTVVQKTHDHTPTDTYIHSVTLFNGHFAGEPEYYNLYSSLDSTVVQKTIQYSPTQHTVKYTQVNLVKTQLISVKIER